MQITETRRYAIMGKTIKETSLRKPRYLGNDLPQVTSVDHQTHNDLDREYLVRALSHDVGAHLMILEYSFRQYEKVANKLALTLPSTQSPPSTTSVDVNGEFCAVGGRIIFRQDAPDLENHAPHNEIQPNKPPKTQRLHLATHLQQTSETDKLTEAASHVTACIDEMKRFVEELISFARTGCIDMEPNAVSVADLIAEVLYEQRGLLEQRNIETIVSSPLPIVFANAMRVKQVLTNLVRNAAIHGCDKSNPMIVIASDMTASGTREMTTFYVRDNGRGIPAAECERIFEPGYRVPGNQNEGSGIGLATVKKIAASYGGNVTCESNETSTTFFVTLPKK